MALLNNLMMSLTGRTYPKGNPARSPLSSSDGFGFVIDPPIRRGLDISVSDDSATTITAVYRAVQLIASTIAALPLHVYEEQNGERVKVHRAFDSYLWGRPNDEVPAVTFWETVIGHEVLHGNAYIWVETNANGDPYRLWPMEPKRMQVKRGDDGVKYYIIDGDVVTRDYLYGGDIVHVAGWGRDGMVGISPIKQMALALGLTKTAEEYAARFFSQGSTLSGVLTTDAQLDEDDAKSLSARWERARSGQSNAHRTAVLSSGLKWTPVSISPEDSQLLSLRQFQVAEVARMFGIPEEKLAAHDKTSSWGTGIEVRNRGFVQETLMPHMIRFEQTINDELLKGARYVKWNLDGFLRGTSAERAAVYAQLRAMGVLSVNEIRALEDLAGIGPDGDTRLEPLNMAPLGQPRQLPPA